MHENSWTASCSPPLLLKLLPSLPQFMQYLEESHPFQVIMIPSPKNCDFNLKITDPSAR